jgi:hypothetical protein
LERSIKSVLTDASVTGFDFIAAVKSAPIGGIDGRCFCFFQLPEFAAAVPRIDVSNNDALFCAMLDLAAAQFRQYHDFSALHVFTGTVAMQQLMTALVGHVSDEVASDLVGGFWALGMAIVAMLPTLNKSRVAVEKSDTPVVETMASAGNVDAAAIETYRAAIRAQKESTPTQFEHQVKLAFACRVACKVRNDASFASTCCHLLAREAARPAPF